MNTNFSKKILLNEIVANYVDWDSSVFGMKVINLDKFLINDLHEFQKLYSEYEVWLQQNNVDMVTSRLSLQNRLEIDYLQSQSFKFVELTFNPLADLRDLKKLEVDTSISVGLIQSSEIDEIIIENKNLFSHGRYHVDPNLPNDLADTRYANWICNAYQSSTQKVLGVRVDGHLIAFFVYEQNELNIYWHLTAVMPAWQGKGLSKKIWSSVISYHLNAGATHLKTCISASNVKVVNLYCQMGFKLTDPKISLHKHIRN